MLQKSVNGVQMDCTPEEEAEMLRLWTEGDARNAKQAILDKPKLELIAKYPDIYKAIDAIYQKLGMTPPGSVTIPVSSTNQ